jgi:hypothetical protein
MKDQEQSESAASAYWSREQGARCSESSTAILKWSSSTRPPDSNLLALANKAKAKSRKQTVRQNISLDEDDCLPFRTLREED